MKKTFENYLIMVGIRSSDYTYTEDQILDNTEYFRGCFDRDISPYYAFLYLNDHIEKKAKK